MVRFARCPVVPAWPRMKSIPGFRQPELGDWRKVVGYAIGRSIDVRLTLAALRSAVERRKPPPAACITAIADRNMLRGVIGKLLLNTVSSDRGGAAAIPPIAPRPRAS